MTSILSFKKTTRAAVAALIIGAASISAMPAQAAGNNVAFGFNFNSGNGISFSIASDNDSNRGRGRDVRHSQRRACMSDRELARGLSRVGFTNIRLGRESRGKVVAEASRGRAEYTMLVDRCDGDVSRLEKKYSRRDSYRDRNDHRRGGHGTRLEFNFR